MQIITLRTLLGSIQKRFFATSISEPPSKSTVDYLVNSCGWPKATAISAARKIDVKKDNPEQCGSIVALFKQHGFSDSQQQKLFVKRPELLTFHLDGMRRKMQFLNESLPRGSFLVDLITSNPVILKPGLKSHIEPSMELLMKYLGSVEKVELALKRASWLLTSKLSSNMQPNVDLLISEGVSLDAVQLMIATRPRAVLQNYDTMACAIKAVKELGVELSSPVFIRALCVRLSMSDATWNGKFDLFRNLGWSNEEIASTFVSDTRFLVCSEEKIRAVTEFIVKTMKLNQSVIIARPVLLTYSIETRYKPRFYVINELKAKNLLNDGLKIIRLMGISEEKFVDNFVKKYEDQVPDLMKIYTCLREGKSVSCNTPSTSWILNWESEKHLQSGLADSNETITQT